LRKSPYVYISRLTRCVNLSPEKWIKKHPETDLSHAGRENGGHRLLWNDFFDHFVIVHDKACTDVLDKCAGFYETRAFIKVYG
jgi:hypothetical protein